MTRRVRPLWPALLLALACLTGCAMPQATAVTVKVLAINDFHGSLRTPPGGLRIPDPADATRTLTVRAGGAEHLATLVAELQAKNPLHVFVAAGDLVGASPLLSALFHDEPTIESLSRMGLRVSAVGNHEFDRGSAELLRLQHGGCPADGCRGARSFGGAGFQYLAAGTRDTRSGRPLLPATHVERFAGVAVAFIGLTLKSTPSMVAARGVRELAFGDEVQTINAEVARLRAQGVAAFVVLLHQGGFPAEGPRVEPDGCTDVNGPIIKLVPRLDQAVAVVVTGHTHRAYNCRIDGRLVTSAGSHGRLLTEIDLELDPARGRVVQAQARNHVVDASRYARDPAQSALIEAYERLAQPLAQRRVARLAGALSREANAAGESPLGQVIADAQLEATRSAGAEVAFMNPGGIRASLPRPADGWLRFEELFAAQPFGNALVTMTLSGAQIVELLEQQWHGQPLAAGRVLQVSSGLAYTWDASRPRGQRVLAGSLRLHGRAIADDSRVRVTVNSFMADGGDHFRALRQGSERHTGMQDIEALEAYLAARPNPLPLLPRITRLH